MSCCKENNVKIAALLVALSQAELRCPKRLDAFIVDQAQHIRSLRDELIKKNSQLAELKDSQEYWKDRAFAAEAQLPSSESPSESEESSDEDEVRG
jgi:hypothetical protein